MADSIEAISSQWLSEALNQNNGRMIGNPSIKSVELVPLTDQGYTSQLLRLHLGYSNNDPSFPKTLIAKLSSGNPSIRQSMISSRRYEKEVRFYQEFAQMVNLRVPICFFSQFDYKTGAHVILLEDLLGSRSGNQFTGCSRPEAELLIREIASFISHGGDIHP